MSVWHHEQAFEFGDNEMKANALSNTGLAKKDAAGKDFAGLEEAVQLFRRALQFQPDHIDALYNLGTAVEMQGKAQLAYDTYQQVVSVAPEHVGAHMNLANIFHRIGKYNLTLYHHSMVLKSRATLGMRETLGILNNMGQVSST
jgi:tetratricopeptide (TPR) repeat protein